MVYVLIVISYFAGAGGNGQYVTFQEFDNHAACRAALSVIEEKRKGWSWDNFRITCVPKG